MSRPGDPPRVLYVAGWGRSGSTMLALALATLPGYVAGGELRFVWRSGLVDDDRCSCGAAFSACPFWTQVGVEAFGGWRNVDPHEALACQARAIRAGRRLAGSGAGRRRSRARHARLVCALYAAIGGVAGADTVIDSSKHPGLAWALVRDARMDVRVAHLVRDSRGVAFSWAKRMPRPEAAGAWFPRFGPLEASRRWAVSNLGAEMLGMAAPLARVRYEAFAAAPTAELARLLHALDLPPAVGGRIGERLVETAGHHMLRGNPVAHDARSAVLTPDRAWETQMPAGRRAAVLAATWPLLRRYGYLTRTRPS